MALLRGICTCISAALDLQEGPVYLSQHLIITSFFVPSADVAVFSRSCCQELVPQTCGFLGSCAVSCVKSQVFQARGRPKWAGRSKSPSVRGDGERNKGGRML